MPWERAPKFAAAGDGADDTEAWRRELEELAESVDPPDRSEFYSLAQQDTLDREGANRLGEIVAKAVEKFPHADQERGGGPAKPSAAALVDLARKVPRATVRTSSTGNFGFASTQNSEPQAAFEISNLDPRNLVRIATVLQMKDRAARVGMYGARLLLRSLLGAKADLRIHLIGHSYGAIVLLAGVCYPPGEDLPSKMDSMLLLQPAVSQWCFAENVAGRGFPGGFRPALERVRGTIFTTFSKHDVPLTRFFHLAVCRDKDLGQPQIAGGGDLPLAPNLYAALGGFGPAGLSENELHVLDIQSAPTRYAFASPIRRVCALNGNEAISGHGGVSVPQIYWTLFQQVDSEGAGRA
jgi:hypothetical protein